MATPEGRARRIREASDTPAMLSNQYKYSHADRVKAAAAMIEKGIGEGVGYQDPYNTGKTQAERTEGDLGGFRDAGRQLNKSVRDLSYQQSLISSIQSGAKAFGLSPDTAKQMGELEALQGKSRSQAAMSLYQGMVDRGEASNIDEAALNQAQIHMSQDKAISKAWGGNVEAYADFLKNNMELSKGQQTGVITAAQAAGVDVGKWGEMQSFMENMRKTGALDAYQKGF